MKTFKSQTNTNSTINLVKHCFSIKLSKKQCTKLKNEKCVGIIKNKNIFYLTDNQIEIKKAIVNNNIILRYKSELERLFFESGKQVWKKVGYKIIDNEKIVFYNN
jgi:hypothetical protein